MEEEEEEHTVAPTVHQHVVAPRVPVTLLSNPSRPLEVVLRPCGQRGGAVEGRPARQGGKAEGRPARQGGKAEEEEGGRGGEERGGPAQQRKGEGVGVARTGTARLRAAAVVDAWKRRIRSAFSASDGSSSPPNVLSSVELASVVVVCGKGGMDDNCRAKTANRMV